MSNAVLKGNASGTGTVTLETPDTNSDRTISLPDDNGTMLYANASGNVGIGTNSPYKPLTIRGLDDRLMFDLDSTSTGVGASVTWNGSTSDLGANPSVRLQGIREGAGAAGALIVSTRNGGSGSTLERMRITSSGDLLVGKTASNIAVNGVELKGGSIQGTVIITNDEATNSSTPLIINRQGSDGALVAFRQANLTEGSISVSGTTVSYNGGHLARWSQLLDGSKDESILKGTVLSNLDEMCLWEKDGVVAENEQLNKMKVSDVEGDTNVAGVFVNWTKDEDYNSDDMNIAMTGDMIIRIADGVVVQKGDLVMSAGDGTAKPQGDDIVRSKTIAKVTSTNITCTYADGSYCVPCVLMAC
jgi:hypothetical protein